MVTRKQERALREEIALLKSEISTYQYYREHHDTALDLLKQHADGMPEKLAMKAKLLFALVELNDCFPPRDLS